MGELDKNLREFLSVATQGKYVPPCKKVAKEEMITLAAMATKKVQEELHELLTVDALDVSISGNMCVCIFSNVIIKCLMQYRGHLV